MARISRDSLQWQSAINTFTSIFLTGIIAIGLAGYYTYQRADNLNINELDIFIFSGIAVSTLILLGLAFSIRIYIELDRPLDHLEQITHALPLLSSKKYDEAKEAFHAVEESSKHHEIDQLHYATLQLTSLLEKLDLNVEQRTKTIRLKSEELQSERDFIQSLVDTAQLIIITIDDAFNITLFNGYGEKMTGFSKSEMLNSPVSKLFPAGNWTDAKVYFNELMAGNLQIAQQESELIDSQGSIRQISWLHSRIESKKSNDRVLSVGLDMTDEKESEKRIVWMAEHDPLTDLINRRKFTEEFEKSLQTAIRYKHTNALLFLDLDQFKDINDTSGHRAGDELLQSVAKTLQEVTRFTDLVARLGGDEFAILIPETDPEGTEILAKKILKKLSEIDLSYGKVKHHISSSIGIVHYPLSDANIHELLGFADLAMYKAKSDGKGTYHTFSPDDQTKDQLETRVFWKHQIEDALSNDHFVLHYQPIVNIKTHKITHYEVLIRMKNKDTEEISMPGKFIQIAEETGLIHKIDHYVMRRSMMKLSMLQKQGIPAKLAINLSGAIADDPLLMPMLKDMIKKTEVKPEGLIFEITETAAVNNLQQAKAMMLAIKALGCRFALDDFGVGFGSFNYMRELPVDIIKIDGLFIKDLDKNQSDQLFVKALADVAKGLGKETIAEFVENKATLELLASYGVDYGQGYYIGRPSPDILNDDNWSANT